MRAIAILAALAAGAPLAAAQPHDPEPFGRTSYTHADPPPPADGWVQLATPTPARFGREFIVVGKDVGPLRQLEIRAKGGKVVVEKVEVFFARGKHETLRVERTLDGKRRSAIVDLHAAAPIDHVVVVTARHTGGQYELYGSSGSGVASR